MRDVLGLGKPRVDSIDSIALRGCQRMDLGTKKPAKQNNQGSETCAPSNSVMDGWKEKGQWAMVIVHDATAAKTLFRHSVERSGQRARSVGGLEV